MKNREGRILYVGKAKNLKKRVLSYFKGEEKLSAKTSRLLAALARIDYLVTRTEKEALILEDNLIKAHRPRYNVVLRDDKAYLCLRLPVRESFPRLTLVRRFKKDGAVYFGPFVSALAVRQTLKNLKKLFPLRTCSDYQFKRRETPCLNHQIGLCLAPCTGRVSPETYHSLVRQVLLFFQGKNQTLLRQIKKEMREAAKNLNFETASLLRDRIQAMEKTLEQQVVFSSSLKDRDCLAILEAEGRIGIGVLSIRGGRMTGARTFSFALGGEGDLPEHLSVFIRQFYKKDRFIPGEILVNLDLPDRAPVKEVLESRREGSVHLHLPKGEIDRALMLTAGENVKEALRKSAVVPGGGEPGPEALARRMRLKNPIHRVEGYDLSSLKGREAAGARVVFLEGEPYPDGYRRYKIISTTRPDDYAMLDEVLRRRFSNPPETDPWPEIMLIDGGKGHIQVAMRVLKEMGVSPAPVVLGLAKGRGGEDQIYLALRKNPLKIPREAAERHFLMRVRDEAHRFVQSYHHLLRKKNQLSSSLKKK